MAASSLESRELTGDGNSAEFVHVGGLLVFTRHDDTGTSGTTKLQFKVDGQDNWQDLPGTSLTESDGFEITLVKCRVRVNLASHSGNSVFGQFQSFA